MMSLTHVLESNVREPVKAKPFSRSRKLVLLANMIFFFFYGKATPCARLQLLHLLEVCRSDTSNEFTFSSSFLRLPINTLLIYCKPVDYRVSVCFIINIKAMNRGHDSKCDCGIVRKVKKAAT